MQEIKCPNCGTMFKIDESGYAQILQQVRDGELEKELERRTRELEEKKEGELALLRVEQEWVRETELARKDAQLAKMEQELARLTAEKEGETTRLQAEKDLELSKLTARMKEQMNSSAAEKDLEISRLTARLQALETAADTQKKLAVSEAIQEKERVLAEQMTCITALRGEIAQKEAESQLKEKSLKESYEDKLRLKDEQIEYYKDFKARQSTKMVGESLEQHCLNQFNAIRMTAFPKAYFEKDNDSKGGSKGDFIFKEAGEDGTEFISIMFEMKNEADATATKKRNEDFLKELDKDRREKKCEYAVLVSLLEIDNDLYNNGIVDVSYRYEKMYVIRPQFFIPMITLLRNAALNSLKYRQELAVMKNRKLDLANFEENMMAFKQGFSRNYDLASRQFADAIKEIDKSIDAMQKTKEALLKSANNLRLANDKAQELSIKRLTKNAPSVRAMFEEYGTEE